MRASPAADVWALGVILYEALTGRAPFDATNLVALVGQVERAPIRPPRSIDSSVDRALEDVCMRALDRDRSRRFRDAEALAPALDDALSGRASVARRRRKGLAVGVVALGAVAAWAWPMSSAPQGDPSVVTPGPAPSPEPSSTEGATEAAPPPLSPVADRTLLRASGARWAAWVDERRVVTGGPDDDVRLWDAGTGEALRSWPRAATAGRLVGPGRVVLASSAGLHVLEVDGDGPPAKLSRLSGAERLDVARDAGVMAVLGRSSDDGRGVFLVWPDGRARLVPLPDEEGEPVSLAISSDGARLAVSLSRSAEDERAESALAPAGPLAVFRVTEEQVTLRDWLTLPSVGEAVAFVSGRGDLIVGSTRGQLGRSPPDERGIVGAFEVERGEPPHAGPVRAIAFTRGGERTLTASDHPDGHQLITWDTATRRMLGRPVVGPGRATSLDVSPDGRAVVVGTLGGGVQVRALGPESPTELAAPPLVDRQLVEAHTPRWAVWVDERHVLTGGDDDDLRLWEAAAGVELRGWEVRARSAARLGGGRVALGGRSGLYVLDLESGPRKLGRLRDVEQVAGAELTGELAVIGHASGAAGVSVHLVSPGGASRAVPLPSDRRRPIAVALSRDGRRLAVSLGGGDALEEAIAVSATIMLFTTEVAVTPQRTATGPGHGTAAAFTADGGEVLVGSNLGQIGVIPFDLGEVMGEFHGTTAPLKAHAGIVRGLAAVPGAGRVLSLADVPGADAAELKVWRYPDPAELSTLTVPGRPRSVDLSPDGRAVVIGTHAHGVHVRLLPP